MSISKLIDTLIKKRNLYDPISSDEKLKLLQNIAHNGYGKTKNICAFHDTLLFIKAHPDNVEIATLAQQALQILCQHILELHPTPQHLEAIKNSGIAHSNIEAAYNFDILRTLIPKYIFFLGFDSFGAEKEKIFEVFNVIIKDIEQIAFTDDEFNFDLWLQQSLSPHPQDKLAQIISLIDESSNNEKLKTSLFAELQLFVKADLNEQFSRTFLQAPFSFTPFYTNSLLKDCDFRSLLQQSLQAPIFLEKQQKQQLIDFAQIQLFCLLKELDAITYADEHSVEVLILERGLSIALYYQKIHKRNLIESLVGYMVFKNGVSISYGAFWIMGHTAKVAFNIFEAFRGGESKFIFSQIIRTAVNHFNVHRILIEPYQFGKNNEEAILSGAFWFYYKLGFRSQDTDLKQLADKEFQKINKNKNYKSSPTVLEKLASSNLELTLVSSSVPNLNATDLALYVSYLIQEKFNGNRIQLENKTSKEMLEALEIKILSSSASLTETESFKKTSILYFDLIPIIKQWNDTDKTDLFHLMKIKLAGNEKEFILKFQQHKTLNYALFDIIQKRPRA